jgi:UDP-N-acetylmuramoyl-L-alanyl-D-glutamate--2,6-diaminopimelate ligase
MSQNDMTSYGIQSAVTGITADSRNAQKGCLFLACPGEKVDGRQFIADAIANGASAVLWEEQGFTWNNDWVAENAPIQNLREKLSEIAGHFYQHPSRKMWMIGVTGTNGKTSITQWLSQCFHYLNRKTAIVGTLGNGLRNQLKDTTTTTPDPVLLQAMLVDFVAQQAEVVAMEVSSHGLAQGRVKGVHVDVAVLSNLTRDHLDYHGTLEAYAAAKQQLFEMDGLQHAVINTDDAFGRQLVAILESHKTPFYSYGIESGDVRASNIVYENTKIRFDVSTPLGFASIGSQVIGKFNVYNVLAVLATLLASKVSLDDAVDAIAQIQSVPGRMQQLGGGEKPLVVVDYAHTPDALEKVLSTLKQQTKSKLVCVFGCGGDRDMGKRPQMGEVASKLADFVVLTNDNPRSENPGDVLSQIAKGIHGNYIVEEDRAKAISIAVLAAKAGDIVLIAGKGHENTQEISGTKTHFSDLEQAQAALATYSEVHA